MSDTEGQAFRQRLLRVEALVDTLERTADPIVRDAARELTQTLLDLHRAGLEKMVARNGQREAWLDDTLFGSLLVLHGLHPVSLETRVGQGLERLRPFLEMHGVVIEHVAASEEKVHVRLRGQGSASRGVLLAIEEAICEAAPDAGPLEIAEPASTRVPLPLVWRAQSPGNSTERAVP